MANTPRVGPVSTSRHRIAKLARQALGMAVAIAWLPGPAGTRRRVAKLSVEEPDAAEPARPDLWGARVSNDPGLPDVRQAWRAAPCLALSIGVRSPLSSGTARCICGGYGRKVTRLTLGDLRACLVLGLPRGSPMGAQKSAEGRRVVAATRGPNK